MEKRISELRIAGAENQTLYEYLRCYTDSRKLDIRKERYNLLVPVFSGTISTLLSMVFYDIMVHQNDRFFWKLVFRRGTTE